MRDHGTDGVAVQTKGVAEGPDPLWLPVGATAESLSAGAEGWDALRVCAPCLGEVMAAPPALTGDLGSSETLAS